MARKTRTQTVAQIAANFPDNNSDLITPAIQRDYLLDNIDSIQYLDLTSTRAALQTIQAANGLVLDQWYKLTNAATSKVLLIKASSANTFYPNAVNLTDGNTGTYDIGTNVFTAAAGGLNNGSNYRSVGCNGTPAENETEFRAQYVAATGLTPNGAAISNSNRVAVVVAPGYINLTTAFDMNAECVDIIALSGNVFFTGGGSFTIVANDVNIKGITFECPMALADNLNLLRMEDCTAGDYSFGNGVTVSGTFINCVGGDFSFAYNGNASGYFENCKAKIQSFGSGFSASGIFINCVAGTGAFGKQGTVSGYFLNCRGENTSFASADSITGKLFGCILEGTNFSTVSGGGITRNCINGDFTPDNQG